MRGRKYLQCKSVWSIRLEFWVFLKLFLFGITPISFNKVKRFTNNMNIIVLWDAYQPIILIYSGSILFSTPDIVYFPCLSSELARVVI